MSVNFYQPHLLILPEDDANRQLANGFLRHHSVITRNIQVLAVAGGWLKVFEKFQAEYTSRLDRYLECQMVLLIDFDGQPNRAFEAMSKVPESLASRVFILGTLTDPEGLKKAGLGNFEAIGLALAQECREEVSKIWSHELLRHNASEMDRLRAIAWPILFGHVPIDRA